MSNGPNQPSRVFLDELYASQDDRFLDELAKFHSASFLKPFVEKWLADPRPWCRKQMIRYIQRELNFAGHEVVFKTLFKHFEHAKDDEIMTYFLVALDQLVRRERLRYWTYNWRQGTSVIRNEVLFASPNKSKVEQTNRFGEYNYGRKRIRYPMADISNKATNRIFSQKTRSYLRRRAWRYFRFMSYREPDRYVQCIAAAMQQYRDRDFAMGENIIDNWSLMHAAYFHAPGISFGPCHCNLAAGGTLAELASSPYRPQAWATDVAAKELVGLITDARSSLVRLWAMELLEREHQSAITQLDIQQLISLMSHIDPRVQDFATRLFPQHGALPTLPVTQWLELIAEAQPNVLPTICQALRQHVAPERLDVLQILQLATARAVPVAELGFDLLKERHAQRPLTTQQFTEIASARCSRLAGEMTTWAFAEIGQQSRYMVDTICEFFDSLQVNVRLAAMSWVREPSAVGYNDPILWARLAETPFEDIRLGMIDCLEKRARLPGQSTDARRHVWQSVILGVHRGGRAKQKAVHQIARDISQRPAEAEKLLPVLAVAVRSLRPPERRAALSAIAGLAVLGADWKARIGNLVHDLQWVESAGAEFGGAEFGGAGGNA